MVSLFFYSEPFPAPKRLPSRSPNLDSFGLWTGISSDSKLRANEPDWRSVDYQKYRRKCDIVVLKARKRLNVERIPSAGSKQKIRVCGQQAKKWKVCHCLKRDIISKGIFLRGTLRQGLRAANKKKRGRIQNSVRLSDSNVMEYKVNSKKIALPDIEVLEVIRGFSAVSRKLVQMKIRISLHRKAER